MPPANNPQIPNQPSYPGPQPAEQPQYGQIPAAPTSAPQSYSPPQPAPQQPQQYGPAPQQPYAQAQYPPQPQSIQQPQYGVPIQPTQQLQPVPNAPQPQNPYQLAQPTQSQPNFPAPAAASNSTASPYDFFLENQPKPKKPLLPKTKSKSGTILLITGAVFMGLFTLMTVLNLVRGGKHETVGLTSVPTAQQDIIHTSDAGLKVIKDPRLTDFAATAKTTTTSAQQQLIAYINTHGGKIDPTKLAVFANPRIDQVLAAAQSAGTYDAAFRTTMQSLLTDYATSLQKILAAKPPASERTILQKDLADCQLLLQLLSQ